MEGFEVTGQEMLLYGYAYEPAAQLLRDEDKAGRVWHREAAKPEFATQVQEHSRIIAAVEPVLETLADEEVTLEKAISEGLVTEEKAVEFYNGLSSLLADPDTKRIALYMPLDFLPPITKKAQNPEIRKAQMNFTDIYMRAWLSQLGDSSIRANFIDGDVIEQDARDSEPERVIKAVHLLPALIDRGLIRVEHIEQLLEFEIPELQKDLREALGVAYQAGLLNEATQKILTDKQVDLTNLPWRQDHSTNGTITPNRQKWLDEQRRSEGIQRMADEMILGYTADLDMSGEYQHLKETDEQLANEVYIEAILEIVKEVAQRNLGDAVKYYDDNSEFLENMWEKATGTEKSRIAKFYRHLHRLRIVDARTMKRIGIQTPDLAGDFVDNLKYMSREIAALNSVVENIQKDEFLSKYVVPVIGVGGSKLKGYGEEDSDADVCVFIGPDTPADLTYEIRYRVLDAMLQEGLYEDPIEVWLEADGDNLKVREFDNYDEHMADKYWTHVLFNWALVGDEHTVTHLRQKLLSGYFYEGEVDEFGDSERKHFLERLEQDLLQYRLMHKGYERHIPLRTTEEITVDSNSVFWDPGFRVLATRLFAKNVFLPKLGA